MAKILVVDDDRGVFESFSALFRGEHIVLGAYNGKEAEKLLQENDIDLIFLDFRQIGYRHGRLQETPSQRSAGSARSR